MMKGNFTGKGKASRMWIACARRCGRESAAVPVPIDDAILRDYLTDALSPEESARVEKAASRGFRRASEPNLRKSARTGPTGSFTRSEPFGTWRG